MKLRGRRMLLSHSSLSRSRGIHLVESVGGGEAGVCRRLCQNRGACACKAVK